MADRRWKRAEREIAALLDGVRLLNSGCGQPDVQAGRLAVQVKTRTSLPAWLLDAVDQAIRDAGVGQQPVVILSVASQGRKARRLLVADLAHVLAHEGSAEAGKPRDGPPDDAERHREHDRADTDERIAS